MVFSPELREPVMFLIVLWGVVVEFNRKLMWILMYIISGCITVTFQQGPEEPRPGFQAEPRVTVNPCRLFPMSKH